MKNISSDLEAISATDIISHLHLRERKKKKKEEEKGKTELEGE